MDDTNWKIDAFATDIYAEIDRVSEATRRITQTLNEGVNKICNILEKKEYGDEKYKFHQAMSQRNSRLFPDSEITDTLQLLLASMKNEGPILR